MSVYITGMEMPKSCHECVAGYGGCCFVAPAESDGICPDHGRADFCPLIPVPDHGRLIDADKALADNEEYYSQLGRPDGVVGASYRSVLRSIISAPTIIQAEEGE